MSDEQSNFLTVPLHDVQPIHGWNEDKARMYAGSMMAGDVFPDVYVRRLLPTGRFLIADGHHRYRAAQICNRATIAVRIVGDVLPPYVPPPHPPVPRYTWSVQLQNVPLADIDMLPHDEDRAERIAAAKGEGAYIPPPDLILREGAPVLFLPDAGRYLIRGGLHRIAAARLAGHTHITARVTTYTKVTP